MKKTLRDIIKETINEGVSPRTMIEKLSAAISLKEWDLVEEVLRDLLEDAKPRVFSPEEEAEIEMWRDRKR
jgi:ribulose 1,5-bisphosphate carboxylase large subunit-like protein